MLGFLNEQVVRFGGKILGFEEHDEFQLTVVEENGPYAYLQSLTDENIGFLVAAPFAFYQNYSFELEDHDKNYLGLDNAEEAAVLSIVTIHEPFTDSTLNLLAPLVINYRTGQAMQIVLPPKSNYGTKEPLFRKVPMERGE